jgi:hypothetical protein
MRLIPILITAAALACTAPFALGGDANNLRDNTLDAKAPQRGVSLSAMLISASNEKGESDRRLAAYVPNLKTSLRFETFKLIGESSARVEMPGSTEIALPQGQTVKVEVAYYGEGKVWMRVIWMDGDRQVMNVVYTKWERGKPAVAGTTKDGQNLALLVTPR